MNKCIFIGNLTRDPEHQTTGSGVSFCRFSIAVNRSYTNSSGEREADFINIVTWRGLADNCAKYLSKGRKVCVVGSLQTRSYDDKDGNKRRQFVFRFRTRKKRRQQESKRTSTRGYRRSAVLINI